MVAIGTSLSVVSSLGYPGLREAADTDAQSGHKRSPGTLSDEDQGKLAELRDRDREVRAHEAAHLAVAGSYAVGGVNLQLTRGPDGGLYATGGDVQIDVSVVSGDPAASIRKAETIRRAALAPASPSPQDRRVAELAGKMALDAEMDLAQHARGNSRNGKEVAGYSNIAITDTAEPKHIDVVA